MRGRPNIAREIKYTANIASAAPKTGKIIAPAIAPNPKKEPTQYICADVAAAPLNAPIAVPVDAVPKAEIYINMPLIVTAFVMLPAATCVIWRARLARLLDT